MVPTGYWNWSGKHGADVVERGYRGCLGDRIALQTRTENLCGHEDQNLSDAGQLPIWLRQRDSP